jgi:heterodisulfide reductase subunit B2
VDTQLIPAQGQVKTRQAYSYYPGCSLHSTGLEYGLSTQAVFRHLGVELVELEDWNCCGASSAHALDHTLAVALPARTLALAQPGGRDLVTPCAACFNRLKRTDYILRTDPDLRAEVEQMVGFKFSGEVTVRPVLAAIYEDFTANDLIELVKRPLKGLKVVPYYGCLLVRPPQVAQFDDPDNPQVMASLLRTIEAQVMDWSYATDCCGAGLSLGRPDVVQNLVGRLVERAREAGAQALATACPLCQVNLEMRQPAKDKMPAFYFTELLGLAFGLPEAKRWWRKHLIDPRPVLRAAGLSD